MRILIPLFFCCLACGSTTKTTEKPLLAKAEIRFLADQNELRGDLQLFRGDSIKNSAPLELPAGTTAFLGSVMTATELPQGQRWRTEMRADFPVDMRFTFPKSAADLDDRYTLPVRLSPPLIDSLPNVLNKEKSLRFTAGTEPLSAPENIVVFFEPLDRKLSPRRIVIAGPTASEKVTIPATAMLDIPTGEHYVYFVKQKLDRDTIDNGQLLGATQISYHTRSKKVVVE